MQFKGIHFTLPDASLFAFPPAPYPTTLPAPVSGSSLYAPAFTIPSNIFNAALDVKVPITIAVLYLFTVTSLNAYNRQHGNKPWAISKTRAFFVFVILHNIALAVYSGWTFVGFLGALSRTVQNPMGPQGLVGTVDSLCKMHGPNNLGSAITFSSASSSWTAQSPSLVRLLDGSPDGSDLGRLWNEGLAFYGWIFYLSKFYEVLDTAIIIAKGKRSPTLQTYHHAGAMMCMWAGIRYMSPPIWMFVLVNSFIHTLMYTYYTLSALSIHVPTPIKRSLTTMQIIQFLVGASYASIHSFISYTTPVLATRPVGSATSLAAKATSLIASGASSIIAEATAAGFADTLKRFLFRAAGEEGLAENVANDASSAAASAAAKVNPHPRHAAPEPSTYTDYLLTPCIDTSGQTFAIWLNVFYLTPLTVLFVRFFIRAYLRRSGSGKKAGPIDGKTIEGKPPGRRESALEVIEGATRDALKGLGREMHEQPDAVVTNGKAQKGRH